MLFQRRNPQRQYAHSQDWHAWKKLWSLAAPLQHLGLPSPTFPILTELLDGWEELRSCLPASPRSQTCSDRKSWWPHNHSSPNHPNLWVVRQTGEPNNIYINKPPKISHNCNHWSQYRLKNKTYGSFRNSLSMAPTSELGKEHSNSAPEPPSFIFPSSSFIPNEKRGIFRSFSAVLQARRAN